MSENIATFVPMDDKETPCRSKINRQRRSTFFRRRSILQAPGELGYEAEDENASQNVHAEENSDTRMLDRIENVYSENCDSTKEQTAFDLRKYINDLKEERRKWKETLLQRKRQYKSILKQQSNMRRGKEDIDLSALSETERNFLLVRPNYEHICEKAKKLSVMAAETSIFNEHVMHLHKRCVLRAEKKLNDLTTRIIKMVD